jgi:Na+-translocating ferredoxin:NAD+ oxidoreductase subunit B
MSHGIIETCTGCTACVKVCPVTAISGERKFKHIINTTICTDCGACGRVCPSAAILDANGKICQSVKKSLWLKPMVLQSRCVACGACIEVCPASVLEFNESGSQGDHVKPTLVDEKNCIGCSFCEAACPTHAIEMRIPVMV